MAWLRESGPTASLWRYVVITIVLRCCTAGDYPEPQALWYPNVSYTQTFTPTCPLIWPADDTVDAVFHSDLYPHGVLRLEKGQYVTAYGPAVNGTDPICWSMLARWEDPGTLMEFELGLGGVLVIAVEHPNLLVIELHSPRGQHARHTNSLFHLTHTSNSWKILAFCFDWHNAQVYAWLRAFPSFHKQFKLTTMGSVSYYPTSLRLGFSPNGEHDNPPMVVMCLMTVSLCLNTIIDMDETEMWTFMQNSCNQLPSNPEAHGCVVNMALSEKVTPELTDELSTPGFTNETTPALSHEPTTQDAMNETTTPSLVTQAPATLHPINDSTLPVATWATPLTEASTRITASAWNFSDRVTPTVEAMTRSCSPTCHCLVTAFSADTIHQETFNDLLLNTANLSSSRRKKESATDNRPSAVYTGYVGILVICVVCFVIVCFDVTSGLQSTKIVHLLQK